MSNGSTKLKQISLLHFFQPKIKMVENESKENQTFQTEKQIVEKIEEDNKAEESKGSDLESQKKQVEKKLEIQQLNVNETKPNEPKIVNKQKETVQKTEKEIGTFQSPNKKRLKAKRNAKEQNEEKSVEEPNAIGLDGSYWQVASSSRTRKKRELQFFDGSHKISQNSPKQKKMVTPEKLEELKIKSKIYQEKKKQEMKEQREEREKQQREFYQFETNGRKVIEGLFIGGKNVVKNPDWMENVQYVVNISNRTYGYQKNISFLKIDIEDSENFKISQYFENACNSIHQNLQEKKNVLVHCQKGTKNNKFDLSLNKKKKKVKVEVLLLFWLILFPKRITLFLMPTIIFLN